MLRGLPKPSLFKEPRGMGLLLDLVLKEGAQAWPDFEIPPQRVNAHLEKCGAQAEEMSPGRAADLYFACACLSGSSPALRRLELLCRDQLRLALRRLKTNADEGETLAAVLEKLLVAKNGAAPKLTQYAGLSELRHWLQAVVTRHICYEKRLLREGKSSPEPLTEAILAELVSSGSPEWQRMEVSAREAFRHALGKTLGALSPRDRNLLRYRLEGLRLSSIAEIYHVSFSTVSRWLASIGVTVKHTVLAELRKTLRLESADSLVHSLLGQISSSIRLELSRGVRNARE
jgi:RNA polymerase sigma-70 factor (ECF subfamily)